MKSTNYSEKVMDHFRHPRNQGHLIGFDVSWGRVGNPVCGDLMDIYIRVHDDIIIDIKFETFGCGSAVATSSMITEMVKGKTLDEAYKVSRGDIAEELDGLPPIKMHCSNLAADALKKAIDNWREGFRVGERLPDEPELVSACASSEVAKKIAKLGKTIEGLDDYKGNGVFNYVNKYEDFSGLRTLILFNGDKSVEIAMKLTEYTNRVILVTDEPSVKTDDPELKTRLKTSAVKILTQSEILRISGEGEVEKVELLELDEKDKFELFVDAVIVLESN
ncbi:MAG: iron-sulfur cluster assembly scaffold protein [Candidatus Lokiarchaeota archaeon]|nr:iron-sulfur cluster assembly scaffold protein [Candidatus Lokiarchaeota archaeon]